MGGEIAILIKQVRQENEGSSEGRREARHASPVLFFEGNAVATKKGAATKKAEALPEVGKEETAPKKTVKRTKSFKKDARECAAEVWPEIVTELVRKAKAGSYNHTKLLVEVSGIKDEEVQPVRRRRDTVSKLLLKKLKEKESGAVE